MRIRSFIAMVLAVLLLSGCGKLPSPPVEPSPEPEITAPVEQEIPAVTPQTDGSALPLPEPQPLYLYTDGGRTLAVDNDGNVVLEEAEGAMELLKDRHSGEIIGLLVQRQEGFQIDEWGNASPLRRWCDLYGLDGSFRASVPLHYPAVYGSLLYGYDQDFMKSKILDLESGELLYDDVMLFGRVGERYFVSCGVWGNPGVILSAEGEELLETPKAYAVEGILDSQYLIVREIGKYGLMDETGSLVLPCAYNEIRSCTDGRVIAEQDDGYAVVDLETGEQLFHWPYPIEMALERSVVVQIDGDYSGCRLVDYSGAPLMEEDFNWINAAAYGDEIDCDLLCGTGFVGDSSIQTYFTPDGTVLNSLTINDHYSELISDTHMVTSHTNWDEETDTHSGTVRILDIATGEVTFEISGEQISGLPVFVNLMTGEGREPGYIYLTCPNAQGWARTAIVHQSGKIVLEDYQDVRYCGGGVVQCTRGFTGGLLRMDGTWLYQEERFNTLED